MLNDSVFPSLSQSAVHSRVKSKDDERQHSSVKGFSQRKNNRKNTGQRFTQYSLVAIPNTFPPKFKTRCVKHSVHQQNRIMTATKASNKPHSRNACRGRVCVTRNGKKLINKTGVLS